MENSFSRRRWTNQIFWRRSGTENIHLDTGTPNSRRRSRRFSWWIKRVSFTTSRLTPEAINDFWSMSGNFIYGHHVEPRVKLYSPREESFPIPLKYIDVSRTAGTNLDDKQERRIDAYWNIDGSWDSSDSWTGFNQFTLLEEKPPDGYMWSGERLTRRQLTPHQIIYGQNTGSKWEQMLSWRRSKNGQLKNQSSIMHEIYEEFISLTLRTRSSKKPLGMLKRNLKCRWLLLCLLPTSVLRKRKWLLILLNLAKLKFVSYTSNWLEPTYDFPKCTMFHLMWILNPQDLLQNRSLETVPICIVWQCFPHDNIVCSDMYDECKRSNEIIVCDRLWSILWLQLQVCWPTTECLVFQYVPSFSISEQFESILLTILPRISILLLWNDVYQCLELILCTVVESFCLPTHNFIPHTSWHDLPCHGTTKRYSDFPSMVIFPLHQRNFWIQTWFCNCTYTEKKNLFHGVRISIPNCKLYLYSISIGFSQIAFPMTVLPKDDRTDFALEERLGLPHWTMILATCVVVDESKCLDIPIWEFSRILEHLPFLLGFKQILIPLLVLSILAVWIWYPWLSLQSFVMLMIRVK